jgi:hypothetical protein
VEVVAQEIAVWLALEDVPDTFELRMRGEAARRLRSDRTSGSINGTQPATPAMILD